MTAGVLARAHWATVADVQRLGLTEGSGVVLGMLDGHILRASRDLWAHTVLIGPTRKGKGVSSVVPTVMSWPDSAVVLDIKGEVYDITAPALMEAGHEVYRFNPAGEVGHALNLMQFVRWDTIRQIADLQRLMESLAIAEESPTEISQYWRGKAIDTLLTVGCYLHYQDHYPETLGGLRQALVDPDCRMAELLQRIDSCAHPQLTATVKAFLREGVQGLKNVPAERRQEVWDSAARYLAIWRDPLVDYHTRTMEIPWERFQDGDVPITVYLQVTAEDLQGRFRPLFRTAVDQLIWRWMDRPVVGTSRRRGLLVMDEAGALRRVPAFETFVSQAAGYGLGSLLVFQSPNQIRRWYGEDNSILDNCGARVFYEPNDSRSAEMYESYMPMVTITEDVKRFAGDRWRPFYNQQVSVMERRHEARLLQDWQFLELGEETCVIRVSGGCAPIRATKLQYYNDRVFRTLAS
jgi:type IV secretion system protein VirD4